MVCTFFGHRDAPQSIESKIEEAIIYLIKNCKVDTFYVGNQGAFDYMVRKTLKSLKNVYPYIKFAVVLAYIPQKKNELEDYSDTIYPEYLANTPSKFAIKKRNKWMVECSDYVITYVRHSYGGAAEYKLLAEKCGKYVINLG